MTRYVEHSPVVNLLTTVRGIIETNWGQGRLETEEGNFCLNGAIYQAGYSYSVTYKAIGLVADEINRRHQGTLFGISAIASFNDSARSLEEVTAIVDNVVAQQVAETLAA